MIHAYEINIDVLIDVLAVRMTHVCRLDVLVELLSCEYAELHGCLLESNVFQVRLLGNLAVRDRRESISSLAM